MVQIYNDVGRFGPIVNYADYQELEVRHDTFVKDVRAALTELENSPEIHVTSQPEEVVGLNDAVDVTINLLMNALDKGKG